MRILDLAIMVVPKFGEIIQTIRMKKKKLLLASLRVFFLFVHNALLFDYTP